MECPFEKLREIVDEATALGLENPNAMTLSSVDTRGHPSSRVVLLKELDERGLVFYTNLKSSKAMEIAANPQVSLNFYWRALGKQVRVRGEARPVADEEADEYFATRERASQLGAWASRQSQRLSNRGELLARVAKFELKFRGQAVPRPEFWSGLRVVPRYFEFWTTGRARLHDRIVFEKDAGGEWVRYRLYP